jgi:hypothetical protein
MNNTNVNVIPAPYVRPPVDVVSLQIRVQSLILFTSATITVFLMGVNDVFLDSRIFVLEGTDYTSWNNDDSYIVNYVLTQLGLTETTTVVTA